MKVVEFDDPSQTIFDVANIEQAELFDGVGAYFNDGIPRDQLSDVLLAEIVRRYLREDQSPPGAQDQTREFDH